jgi:hypothetical protein
VKHKKELEFLKEEILVMKAVCGHQNSKSFQQNTTLSFNWWVRVTEREIQSPNTKHQTVTKFLFVCSFLLIFHTFFSVVELFDTYETDTTLYIVMELYLVILWFLLSNMNKSKEKRQFIFLFWTLWLEYWEENCLIKLWPKGLTVSQIVQPSSNKSFMEFSSVIQNESFIAISKYSSLISSFIVTME